MQLKTFTVTLIIKVENEYGKKEDFVLHTSNEDKNSHHGLGILVSKNLAPTFKKINNRISTVMIKENNITTTIIAIYAPTPSNCNREPKLREDFYESLNGTIEKVPKRNFLAGDFNAKTGSGHQLYKEHRGKYGKGQMNESEKALLELCSKHDLVITNILFPHKLSHRTTWTAPNRKYITHDGTGRRNPIRNQIDCLIIRIQHKHLIQDSRSYGGTETDKDHKMVICKINIDTQKIHSKNNIKPKTNISAFANKKNQEEYQQKINENFKEENQNAKEKWNNISRIWVDKAKETLGERTKYQKHNDERIKKLTQENKKLRIEIENCNDMDIKLRKKEKRIDIQKEINTKMKELTENELNLELEELEKAKNDSNKYFLVMKELQNKIRKTETLLVKDDKGNIAGSDQEKVKLIAEHFKEVLAPKGKETNKEYKPCEMTTPFVKEEIEAAAKSLKNGKSAGIDDVTAEHIKYAPMKIHQSIAELLNGTAKTGDGPDEISIGILTPLQKPPPKKKGPCENLRPIMLLSVIRKILTICLIKRTWDRISSSIPYDQAAYQAGRSTTEQVFAAKVLIEKAITSSDYKLDMSKAFDTVDRKTLFENLEKILLREELH